MSIWSNVVRELVPDEYADLSGVVEEITRYLNYYDEQYRRAMEENRRIMDCVYEGCDLATSNALTEEMYDIWIYYEALRSYYVAYGEIQAMQDYLGIVDGRPELQQAEAGFKQYCEQTFMKDLKDKARRQADRVEKILANETKIAQFRQYCARKKEIDRLLSEHYMQGGYELQRARWPDETREDKLADRGQWFRLIDK